MEEAILNLARTFLHLLHTYTGIYLEQVFAESSVYKHNLNFVENSTQQSQDLKYQHNAIMRRSKTLYLK